MELSNRYKRVACEQITVRREERQRTKIDTSDIDSSIQQRGVLNPIIVTKDLVLVAGERRLCSSIKLGLADIPVRFAEDLSPIEAQIIELEENLKRQDLTWRDQAKAIARLHQLYVAQAPGWSQLQTSSSLGLSSSYISQILRVNAEIDSPKLAQATNLAAAFNALARKDERAAADAVSDILEAAQGIVAQAEPLAAAGAGFVPLTIGSEIAAGIPIAPALPQPKPESILNLDFLQWAPQYTGPRFSFIHCDFPYGINVFSGPQSGKTTQDTYSDDPDLYWALIQCLGQNLDRLMAHSGHLMFWFSMEHYHATFEAFRRFAPSLAIQGFPLVWVKSDNVGILPDPKRGPRRIYETALIASREDRLIIKAVSNAYSAPTDKTHHTSTKPEPVLRHFMSMFVDENTRMLDPTCGGGSSLRAAESLGAKEVLGLEIDETHCTNARSALRQFRILRSASK